MRKKIHILITLMLVGMTLMGCSSGSGTGRDEGGSSSLPTLPIIAPVLITPPVSVLPGLSDTPISETISEPESQPVHDSVTSPSDTPTVTPTSPGDPSVTQPTVDPTLPLGQPVAEPISNVVEIVVTTPTETLTLPVPVKVADGQTENDGVTELPDTSEPVGSDSSDASLDPIIPVTVTEPSQEGDSGAGSDSGSADQTDQEDSVVISGRCLGKKNVQITWFISNKGNSQKSNKVKCVSDRFEQKIKDKKENLPRLQVQIIYY